MKNLNTLINQLNKKHSPGIFIVFSNFLCFIFGLGKADERIMQLDQKIMLLTSSKMHYFDLNTFEAAWNHHTPPIFYFFRLTYLFSEFSNINFGFYVLYSILLLSINLLLYRICYKLTKQKLLSIFLSSAFVFDLSSVTIGGNVIFDNRTIGIFIQCFILFFSFKLIEEQDKKTTIFFSTVIFLQILFLESYIISCGLIFLYLFSRLKNKSEFLKLFFISNIFLTFLFATVFNLNSELINTINLNYIFHFDGIGLGSNTKIALNELLNFGLFYHWSHNRIFYILTFLFIFTFILFKNKLNINKLSIEYFSFIIIYFMAELLHVFLTGPRFTNYLQVILLPQYLLIFVYIFYLLTSSRLNVINVNILSFSILFVMFFSFQFGDVVYWRTSLFDKSYLTYKENYLEDSTVSEYLFEPGRPELVLTWISNKSWDEIYFKSNKLPASRMWWWFEMKYVESYYEWKPGRYYNSNLEEIFIKDLNRDKPQLAIVEKGYVLPPDFFIDYLEENYIFINELEQFYIYQLKSKS